MTPSMREKRSTYERIVLMPTSSITQFCLLVLNRVFGCIPQIQNWGFLDHGLEFTVIFLQGDQAFACFWEFTLSYFRLDLVIFFPQLNRKVIGDQWKVLQLLAFLNYVAVVFRSRPKKPSFNFGKTPTKNHNIALSIRSLLQNEPIFPAS